MPAEQVYPDDTGIPSRGRAQDAIKPYARHGHFLMLDNAIIDHALPTLSGAETKVLLYILRKTRGWGKEADRLAGTQIQEGTGIRSRNTVDRALEGLEHKGHILVTTERDPGGRNLARLVALNRDFQIATPPQKPSSDCEPYQAQKLSTAQAQKVSLAQAQKVSTHEDSGVGGQRISPEKTAGSRRAQTQQEEQEHEETAERTDNGTRVLEEQGAPEKPPPSARPQKAGRPPTPPKSSAGAPRTLAGKIRLDVDRILGAEVPAGQGPSGKDADVTRIASHLASRLGRTASGGWSQALAAVCGERGWEAELGRVAAEAAVSEVSKASGWAPAVLAAQVKEAEVEPDAGLPDAGWARYLAAFTAASRPTQEREAHEDGRQSLAGRTASPILGVRDPAVERSPEDYFQRGGSKARR